MAREPIIFDGFDMDSADNKRRLQMSIGALHGSWHVKIKPCDPRRSNPQNAYFHGCIVPMMAAWLKEQGWEEHSPDFAKQLLKQKHLNVFVSDPETGDMISVPRETHKLGRLEFADFCDACRAWMLKYCGVFVPEPDPRWREQAAELEYQEQQGKERDNEQ